MQFVYLHGFASSPRSTKAQNLLDRFTALGLRVEMPDLNQGDFAHLTLSRQLHQVKTLLSELLPDESVTVIGSSFGGLTAAWLGEHCPQIERLVLLAPAFGFLNHWLPQIDPVQLTRWQSGEPFLVYHYSENQHLPLEYDFVTDLEKYPESQLKKPIPTLILHGTNDAVIPIQASRSYAKNRPWVRLIELQSDHSLTDQITPIWQSIGQFCKLTPEQEDQDL